MAMFCVCPSTPHPHTHAVSTHNNILSALEVKRARPGESSGLALTNTVVTPAPPMEPMASGAAHMWRWVIRARLVAQGDPGQASSAG